MTNDRLEMLRKLTIVSYPDDPSKFGAERELAGAVPALLAEIALMRAVVEAACAYVDAARSPTNLSPTLYNEIAAPVDAYRKAKR